MCYSKNDNNKVVDWIKMTNNNSSLSITEKVGYSLGDLAANLIFQTLMTFLAFFYTDVYNIPANKAAAIIFIGGMIGACFNPIMGIIADRTVTRWGKFRPWILWTAIPFGVSALLAFSTPDFSDDGKVIYALTTYVFLVLMYSANNLPYAALSGVLTGNMKERNSLSSYRFVAVMVAQFIIQVLLLPLVIILGDGDKALGFTKAMTVFSLVGIVFFLITFLTTRERVVPAVEQKSSIKQDILDLLKNRPWLIILSVTILIFITLALKGGMTIYYFQHYLDVGQIAIFLENSGFNTFIANLNNVLIGAGLSEFQWPKDAATSGFSLFNACGILFMIVGIGVSKPLADRYGKRDVFSLSLAIAAITLALFYFYSPQSIIAVFSTQIIHGYFYGITIPLLWAMIADVADYSEWKNNRRATAIIFSAMIFGLKVGLSVGGSLVAIILAYYGYSNELAVQASDTTEGIKFSISLISALPFVLAILILFAYEINKKMEHLIESDLFQRRVT